MPSLTLVVPSYSGLACYKSWAVVTSLAEGLLVVVSGYRTVVVVACSRSCCGGVVVAVVVVSLAGGC